MATFTVIVPTLGRPSLQATLATIVSQLEPGDELLTVFNDDHDFGNAARNSAIERARGSHLVFMDDDDEWVPGARATLARFVDEHPDRVGIFRCLIELVGDGPQAPELGGSVNFLVPNVPGKVGRFRPAGTGGPGYRPRRPHETPEHYSQRLGDVVFMRSTLELRGDEPIWMPDVTVVLRPEKNRLRRLRYSLHLRTRVTALARSRPRLRRSPKLRHLHGH